MHFVVACAVCMGASDSRLAQGMNAGVLVLLAVTVGVLAAIAGTAYVIARRGRAVSATS
jgi:hypothetical protein